MATPSDVASAAGTEREAHPSRGHRPELLRPPALAFLLSELVAAAVYVDVARRAWFFGVFGDEWDFLAGRRLTFHDLLLRHGDHLVALPALVFRALFAVFGLRAYLPYQLVAIALHLVAAALLRVIILRSGVHPWLATAAAASFALFGPGSQDVLIAFQMTFGGALVFGLAQLLLVDHDGAIDRRDWFALAAGFASLACSDVSLVMIVVAGVAALLRRRWLAAAMQTVPLAVAFAVWSAFFGRTARASFRVARVTKSMQRSISATLDALGHFPFLGWVITAILVMGLVAAVHDATKRRVRPRSTAAPIALLAGALLFAAFLGVTRFGLGAQFAASSRYLHVLAAMALPAIAVAADTLGRRHRVLLVAATAVLLVGAPWNVAEAGRNLAPADRYRAERRVITALPRYALARRVPASVHPAPSFAAEVTVGWLLANDRDGRIPAPAPATAAQRATDLLRLSLAQRAGPRLRSCTRLRAPAQRRLAQGGELRLRGAVLVVTLDDAGAPTSTPLPFGTSLLSTEATHVLLAVGGPLRLRIVPASPGAALC